MSVSRSFLDKLQARMEKVDSFLCVGLDPHVQELGLDESASEEARCDAAWTFCVTLVQATLPEAACYKPNAAFFEGLGCNQGMALLQRVCRDLIPPDVPILLDVKRGDIGSTATAYAVSAYDHIGADAVTLSPLMGWDSVAPFVTGTYANKAAFLLCKTSNPGSADFLAQRSGEDVLYEKIALKAAEWSAAHNCFLGLVVGATDPVALAAVRKRSPEAWILAPGVGAQGGSLEDTVQAGLFGSGKGGLLVPVSRGISRAADPAQAALELTQRLRAAQAAVQEKATASETADTATTKIAPYQREFLEFSLKQGVLKFGSFVLKSGRTSPYFFNAGLFCSGGALHQLGAAYASAIMNAPQLTKDGKVQFDVLFGPAYKGISLAAVVSSVLYSDFGVDVGYAYNRKEAKDHGEGGLLVGASMTEKKVLIVDDVITAGTAIRESHTLLQTAKAIPVGVVIALDRAEVRSLEDRVSAVQAVARDLQLPVVSIVNLQQVQAYLQESREIYGEETLETVTRYREQYGVS